MGLFEDGFEAFVTPIKDFNDGLEECGAQLQATKANKTVTYYGTTRNGHGHAEIDALYQFLETIEWDATEFKQYTLTITCESKPCCKYCAAIMGNLGIFATPGTYKVNKAMGISYSLPPKIRTFLGQVFGKNERTILDEFSG